MVTSAASTNFSSSAMTGSPPLAIPASVWSSSASSHSSPSVRPVRDSSSPCAVSPGARLATEQVSIRSR